MIQVSPLNFIAVFGMSLPQGFIRRKGILAPRIDHQAQNCYKTFKLGRNKIICTPNKAVLDGQNSPLILNGILGFMNNVETLFESTIMCSFVFLVYKYFLVYQQIRHGPSGCCTRLALLFESLLILTETRAEYHSWPFTSE
jgi:hypothetical protein